MQEQQTEILNKKLNIIMDAQDDIIVTTNGINLTYVNQAFFRFSDFKNNEEFLKSHKCICELFLDLGGDEFLKANYDNGDTWITHYLRYPDKDFFVMIKNKNSENILFKVKLSVLIEDEYVATFQNVTMHEENRNMIDIISQMKGLYFSIADMTGKILSISKSLLEELHINDFFPKKYSISDFFNDEDTLISLEHIKQNDSSPYEVTIIHNNISIPVFTQGYFGVINQQPVRVAAIMDLSEIKKLQSEAQDRELLLMQQSKMVQMGEMVSMIAHQWRQPLNAISAASIQCTLKHELDTLEKEDFKKSQKLIQEQCQKMSKVINSFMNFSNNNYKEDDFTMESVIETVLSMLEEQFLSYDIPIKVNLNDTFKVHGDISMLEQVILNLLINAKDAYNDNKERQNNIIKIDATRDRTLEIVDFAGGISDENREKVFMPYFTTKELGKGTGLGLYMSKKIMQDHFKGSLLYEKLENGSKFILDFKEN